MSLQMTAVSLSYGSSIFDHCVKGILAMQNLCAFVQLCHAFPYIFSCAFIKFIFAFLWHFLIDALRFRNTAVCSLHTRGHLYQGHRRRGFGRQWSLSILLIHWCQWWVPRRLFSDAKMHRMVLPAIARLSCFKSCVCQTFQWVAYLWQAEMYWRWWLIDSHESWLIWCCDAVTCL